MSNDSTCLICLEDYLENNNKRWLIRTSNCECQKIYHLKCFLDWYKENKQCPICHNSAIDDNWQVMIYHNKKWKMIPFNFITDMISDNDFFHTIIDINENQEEEKKNNCETTYCLMFYFSIVYNIILTVIIFTSYI